MKKNRNLRLPALVLALTMLVLCLSGCGRRETAPRQTEAVQTAVPETTVPAEPEATKPEKPEGTAADFEKKAREIMKQPSDISMDQLKNAISKAGKTEQDPDKFAELIKKKNEEWRSYSDTQFQMPEETIYGSAAPRTIQIDYTRLSYQTGNCRDLSGNPYVITIFLDDNVSSWSEQEVLNAIWYQVNPGLEYLEQEAAKWGVYLDFNQGYYATYGHPDQPVRYNGVISDFMTDGTTTRDILDQAAVSLGFDSREHMHTCLKEHSGQEQIIYMFMLNKYGRSYASTYNMDSAIECEERGEGVNLLESVVIFSGFGYEYGDTGPDTIAHETLHVFGAEDYYMPDARKALAEQYYPTDIMLCRMPDINSFTLGDFTAYCVGWTDQVPAICSNPEWWAGR